MKIRKREGVAAEDSGLLHPRQEYVVYGISFKASPEFLIYEPDELSFPFFVASEAVELIDARLSNCWSYSPPLPSTEVFSSRAPLVSFEAMVRDRRYYQALVDGERVAVATWEEAKRLIDSEGRE
jgi:hypothetical protein